MAATIDDLLNELRLSRQGQEASNDEARKQAEEANALQLKRENIERKLLGQSEKQYDAMLKQRKIAEEAKKEMEEIQEVLGEDAENNK